MTLIEMLRLAAANMAGEDHARGMLAKARYLEKQITWLERGIKRLPRDAVHRGIRSAQLRSLKILNRAKPTRKRPRKGTP